MKTASAAASAEPTDAMEHNGPQHPLPLHSAPSMQDMLALKRQRRSLDKGAVEEQLSSEDALLSSPTFALPTLPAEPGEPMSGYFHRLRQWLDVQPLPKEAQALSCLGPDGVYIHKRPIRGPNGSSPLAVCGSVLHHVLVLVKQDPLVHILDFGPANGADVTSNILEEVPAKRVRATVPAAEIQAAELSSAALTGAAGGAAPAVAAAQEKLPYMYLGPAASDVEHRLVQQVVAFAESRPYHALRNNCIHFADVLVRVLTAGAVRGAPLLYDMVCGSVPPVDNPMLLMMQLMLRMPWFVVVDGSPLAAAFLEHCRTSPAGLQSLSQQPTDPRDAVIDPEEQDNNTGAAAAAAAEPTAAPPPVVSEGSGSMSVALAAAAQGMPSSGKAATCVPPPQGSEKLGGAQGAGVGGVEPPQQASTDVVALGQYDEERRQERDNDHALCEVEPEAVAAKA